MRVRDLPATLPRPPIQEQAYGRTLSGETYELLNRLGEGAAGVVYSCQRLGDAEGASAKKYAMKILWPLQHIVKSEHGYERLHKRFIQESTRPTHLTHPGLVEILDHGDIEYGGEVGRPFCLMNFIEGQALNALFAQPALALWHRLDLVIELGQVLRFMHENGVLHRDVKPANIIIESETAKLILSDFGVVQWGDWASQYTDGIETYSSEILTTWAYLPPEVEIEPMAYDVVAETWSYGKTVAEILAWRQIARGSLLTGLFRLEDCVDGGCLPGIANTLLVANREKRSSIELALSRMKWYRGLWEQTRRLSEANLQTARGALRDHLAKMDPVKRDHYLASFDASLDRLRREQLPEEFGYVDYVLQYDNAWKTVGRCPRCDSQCVIKYRHEAFSDGDMEIEHVCLGVPGKPCGYVGELPWG